MTRSNVRYAGRRTNVRTYVLLERCDRRDEVSVFIAWCLLLSFSSYIFAGNPLSSQLPAVCARTHWCTRGRGTVAEGCYCYCQLLLLLRYHSARRKRWIGDEERTTAPLPCRLHRSISRAAVATTRLVSQPPGGHNLSVTDFSSHLGTHFDIAQYRIIQTSDNRCIM